MTRVALGGAALALGGAALVMDFLSFAIAKSVSLSWAVVAILLVLAVARCALRLTGLYDAVLVIETKAKRGEPSAMIGICIVQGLTTVAVVMGAVTLAGVAH